VSETPSTQLLPLGAEAPEIGLADVVTGKTVWLSTFVANKALLVVFLCNHCPFVKHVRDEIARIAMDYASQGLAVVGISSNDVETHPQDDPVQLRNMARDAGFRFPVCYDQYQEVAKAYRAACTPDFFLFGAANRLAYRGQLDDSRPGNEIPVTGRDLRLAIRAVLDGKPPLATQKPSVGCNIKWKPGSEPSYYGRRK
jgi:peroxiredoxin